MGIPLDDLNLINGSSLTKCRFLAQDGQETLKRIQHFAEKEPIANGKLNDWVLVECNKRHFDGEISVEAFQKHVFALVRKYFVLGFNTGKETYEIGGNKDE